MTDRAVAERPRAVGSRVRRLDALEKVTGRARYGTELSATGMLQAAVLRSDRPHARIVRLDTTRAEAADGVLAVATAADAPGFFGSVYKELSTFARDKVRYPGEPIAAVAAETLEEAEAALALIEVDYEDLPAVFDPLEAIEPGAPLLHDDLNAYGGPSDLGREGNVCVRVLLERGDVERALTNSDLVVEQVYFAPSVHQSPIEPRAALAEWDANGRLNVWATTQGGFATRAQLADVFQIPVSQIRVVSTTVGGGFGSKIELKVEHIAAALARKARRPVKLVNSRAEELSYGTPRHPHHITITSGVRRDGTLVARRVRVIQDSGAYSADTPLLAAVAAHMGTGPYRIPDARIEVLGALTNKPAFGAFRAPSGPQMVFAVEGHMDVIAEKLGMDPLDLRLLNAWRDGDVALNGQVLRDPAVIEALERAAGAIGWRQGRRSEREGRLRGKGIACAWWATIGGNSAAVTRLNEDGSVTLVSGAAELGGGSYTTMAQFAADAMDVPFDQVRLSIPDTDSAPYDMMAGGSRTTFNQGKAIQLAAGELRTKMLALAGQMLEVSPDDVELVAGTAQVRGAPGRALTYRDLGSASLEQGGQLIGSGTYLAPAAEFDPSTMHGCLMPNWNSPSYFCHAADVEVDPDTGQVRVLDYVAAHDVGLAVHPTYTEGQIEGGTIQGFGMALVEELIYEDGALQNRDWSLYKLPSAPEAPRIRSIVLTHPDAEGPNGAKGLGEGPIIPPPATIANAVAAATGVRLTTLPIAAEAVLRGLEETRA